MKNTLRILAAVCFLGAGTAGALAAGEMSAGVKEQLLKATETKVRDELKAKEWTVRMTPKEGQKKVEFETDTLTFTEGTVASKSLAEKGFPASNYSLTPQEDGSGVWETMQANEAAGDLAFFRGELKNGLMKGTFSFQPKKGTRTTYYFTSEATPAEVKPAAVQEEPAPKAAPAKKGWGRR